MLESGDRFYGPRLSQAQRSAGRPPTTSQHARQVDTLRLGQPRSNNRPAKPAHHPIYELRAFNPDLCYNYHVPGKKNQEEPAALGRPPLKPSAAANSPAEDEKHKRRIIRIGLPTGPVNPPSPGNLSGTK